MKKRYLLIGIIPVLLISLSFKFEPVNNFPLFGKFIILDPGHGSEDPGSIYKDEYEKNYNLEFAKSLEKVLIKKGASVMLTRTGDYDLSSPDAKRRKRSDFNNRIKLINEDKPELYLSLHMNYLNDSRYYGSQVFYSDVIPQNSRLADILQKHINTFFDFDKDYKEVGDDLYMFSKIEVPGVLVEYGFMSSAKDRANLKKEAYRSNLAEVIAEGIIEYFT